MQCILVCVGQQMYSFLMICVVCFIGDVPFSWYFGLIKGYGILALKVVYTIGTIILCIVYSTRMYFKDWNNFAKDIKESNRKELQKILEEKDKTET